MTPTLRVALSPQRQWSTVAFWESSSSAPADRSGPESSTQRLGTPGFVCSPQGPELGVGYSPPSPLQLLVLMGSPCVVEGLPKEGPSVSAKLRVPTCHPCTCLLDLSKSQNDVTSDKQLLSTSPVQGAGRTERRSQSDTAINVTTRVFPRATRPSRNCSLAYFL